MLLKFLPTRKLKVNIHKNKVDREHRFGEVYTDRNGNRQQAVLAKFTSWDARNRFYRARKKSNFYGKADLTKQKDNVLKYAREKIRSDPGVSKFIGFVYVDDNCNQVAFTLTGRFMKFNSERGFDYLVSYVDNTHNGK